MKIGIYPGSFDPVTLGHIDIIERASNLVDKLIVAVLKNPLKKSHFTTEERIDMLVNSVKEYKNVEVKHFDGLLVDFAKSQNANVIVRGLRAVADFEYELQMAQTNKELCPEIDTIFLFTNIKYSYLSSSVVRETAMFKGDTSKFVNKYVEEKLKESYK